MNPDRKTKLMVKKDVEKRKKVYSQFTEDWLMEEKLDYY